MTMIPKIIHYSWFSGEPMPKAILGFIETWKKYLPDYELVLWDAERVKEVDNLFVQEALSERKWAFAADVVRLYAVYHYGGIWLDTDVEVFKSFDRFLDYRMFIGKETTPYYQQDGSGRHLLGLTSHCFGAEKEHPFIKRCLDFYQDRHFVLSKDQSLPERLRYDMRLMPDMQACIADAEFGYYGSVKDLDREDVLKEDIHVFPTIYFDIPKYSSMDSVYAVHHVHGAWLPQNYQLKHDQIETYMPRKKDLRFYLFAILNKYMMTKGYFLRVLSF